MDILQVLGNTLLHFVFFGVNLILLPALVIRLTQSFANPFMPKLSTVRMYLKQPLNTLITLITFPIHFIFGNGKTNLEGLKRGVKLGLAIASQDEGEQIALLEDIYENLDGTPPIFNIWRQIGFYITNMICFCAPPALTVLLISLLLPETYAGITARLGSWIALQSGTPNLAFFARMLATFKDIVWDGFIMGALNENILILLVVIVVSIFIFGAVDMNMLYVDVFDFSGDVYRDQEGNLVDENGTIIMSKNGKMGKKKRIFFKTWMCLPTLAIVLVAFNFIFALINYQAYLGVAYALNSAGMVALLVLIVQIILTLAFTCPKLLLKLIKNKIGI